MTTRLNRLDTLRLAIVGLAALAVLAVLSGCSRPDAPASASTPQTAESIVRSAVAEAMAAHKNVLVDFGASWCVWCTRFDAAIHSPELKELFADNYVVVQLVAQESDEKTAMETPGATEMMKQESGEGLPFYMFLDGNGARITDSMSMPKHGNIGYPATPEELQTFGQLLEKTAPRLSEAQRQTILDYLKNHPS